MDELIKMILQNPNAAAFTEMSLKYDESFISCQILNTGNSIKYLPSKYAFPIKKNSPFYDAFAYHITKMKETGMVQRLFQLYDVQDQRCPDLSGMPLSSNQCCTAFGILAFGVCLTILWLG